MFSPRYLYSFGVEIKQFEDEREIEQKKIKPFFCSRPSCYSFPAGRIKGVTVFRCSDLIVSAVFFHSSRMFVRGKYLLDGSTG